MLESIDSIRRTVASKITISHKMNLGQYLTPIQVARFMASLFTDAGTDSAVILDPGAGIGSLSCAFLDRIREGGLTFKKVELRAIEIDPTLLPLLNASLDVYSKSQNFQRNVEAIDFIDRAVNNIQLSYKSKITHVILNPPYKKISSASPQRLLLRKVGLETVNLYSAFTALSLALLAPGGQLVAIIPRSFCNGPYYRSFRQYILKNAAIRQVHLFGARDKAFKDDKVLQENIIIFLEREGKQGDVKISTSTDARFIDYKDHLYPFEQIILPGDTEQFIHIPTSLKRNSIEMSSKIRYSLDDLEIEVSTGPVVDFRVRKHLRKMPGQGTVPLLYPMHCVGLITEWPKRNLKKPNALMRNDDTENWLYPKGFYPVVRRFSSKEEKRRIVASIVDPSAFPDSFVLGFENHLNVFHYRKQGLPEDIVRGLVLFLNSTAVDQYFRQFNGHTQVNATDLRQMKYPSRKVLIALGKWSKKQPNLMQEKVDEKINSII